MFELSADNAVEYARQRGLIGPAQQTRIESLTGGVSCTTVRLHPEGARPIVIKQALPKLLVKADWRSDPERSRFEVLAIRFATRVIGAENVPDVIDEDDENHILTMASADVSAENWKTQMMHGNVRLETARECAEILAALQSVAPDSPIMPQELRDKTFFRQLRLEAYFEASARIETDVAGELHELIEVHDREAFCFTHADYTPKNFLVCDGRLFLLDFEVAHIGHYAFDPASILNHLFLKSRKFPEWADRFRAASREFLGRYCELTGVAPDDAIIWKCLGGLMLARVRGKSPVEYLQPELHPSVIKTAKALLRGEVRDLDGTYNFQPPGR